MLLMSYRSLETARLTISWRSETAVDSAQYYWVRYCNSHFLNDMMVKFPFFFFTIKETVKSITETQKSLLIIAPERKGSPGTNQLQSKGILKSFLCKKTYLYSRYLRGDCITKRWQATFIILHLVLCFRTRRHYKWRQGGKRPVTALEHLPA